MSAKHALLGLLLDRPAYSYELADRMRSRFGPSWDINSGQLSQTLKLLERDGLIQPVDAAAGEQRRRRIFAATDLGVAEFDSWFAGETASAALCRRPLLVKITLAGPERLQATLAHIDVYESECARRLTELAKGREDVVVDGSMVRADHVLLRLGLCADIFQLEGELRWARHAREIVSWLLERDAIWPSKQAAAEAQRTAQDRRSAQKELFARMAARHLESVEPEI